MKLKQLKDWLAEAEKTHGENAVIEVLTTDSQEQYSIENMVYSFSEKVLFLEIAD